MATPLPPDPSPELQTAQLALNTAVGGIMAAGGVSARTTLLLSVANIAVGTLISSAGLVEGQSAFHPLPAARSIVFTMAGWWVAHAAKTDLARTRGVAPAAVPAAWPMTSFVATRP